MMIPVLGLKQACLPSHWERESIAPTLEEMTVWQKKKKYYVQSAKKAQNSKTLGDYKMFRNVLMLELKI